MTTRSSAPVKLPLTFDGAVTLALGATIVAVGMVAGAILGNMRRAVVVQPSPEYPLGRKGDREPWSPPKPPGFAQAWLRTAPIDFEGQIPVQAKVEPTAKFEAVVAKSAMDVATPWPPLGEDPAASRRQLRPPRDLCSAHKLRKVWVSRYRWRCQK